MVTPMFQILSIVITSCTSSVLFCFYYLMSCYISHLGLDRLWPNENEHFAPNLGQRAAHLRGSVL